MPGVLDDVEAPWLRWIDRDGRVLPEPSEQAVREAENAKGEAENAKREAQRADDAEAEIARLRAERSRPPP